MRVYIDSSCDILYSSFYIKGLYDRFNKSNVFFSSKYFKKFKHGNHFFSFVIENGESIKKIVIDFTDSCIIDEEALEWSDLYCKVNLDAYGIVNNKLFSIGPSFGIKLYSMHETLWYAFTNFLRAYNRIPNKKSFFSNYKAQLKRLSLSEYKNTENSKKDFIYFVASLWKKEKQTNQFRANFIRASKANTSIETKVGFAPRTKNDIVGFEDITLDRRHDISDYFNQIKISSMVFNTPAVLDCHGWKLAEFLALGKAIISTPLSRELPSFLNDKEHLLYTDGSYEDILNKINLLFNNDLLRKELEKKSRNYFDEFLEPEVVIKRILVKLNMF